MATQNRYAVLAMLAAFSFLLTVCPAGVAKTTAPKVRPPEFRVAEIPFPAADTAACDLSFATAVYARRLNDLGQAVGWVDCYLPTGNAATPWVGYRFALSWTRATSSFLIAPASTSAEPSRADEINESGTVVVTRQTPGPGLIAGASIWIPGVGSAQIEDPFTCRTSALTAGGINDSGTIAFRTYRPWGPYCLPALVLRRASGEEVVGPGLRAYAINNNEVAVGYLASGAVKWSPDLGLVELSEQEAGKFKAGLNLNQRADVVGYIEEDDASGVALHRDAMLWPAGGGEVSLAKMYGYPSSIASGISEDGTIVGYSEVGASDDFSVRRATIWYSGKAWDLNSLVKDNEGVRLTSATSINSSGQILVQGFRTSEPEKPCPKFVWDVGSQQWLYVASATCRSQLSFLLTPK